MTLNREHPNRPYKYQNSFNESINNESFQRTYYLWRGRSGKAACHLSVWTETQGRQSEFFGQTFWLEPKSFWQPLPHCIMPPCTHWQTHSTLALTITHGHLYTHTFTTVQLSGLEPLQISDIHLLHWWTVGADFLKTMEWTNLQICQWIWCPKPAVSLTSCEKNSHLFLLILPKPWSLLNRVDYQRCSVSN